MAVRRFVLELPVGAQILPTCVVGTPWGLVSVASMRLLNLVMFGVFIW